WLTHGPRGMFAVTVIAVGRGGRVFIDSIVKGKTCKRCEYVLAGKPNFDEFNRAILYHEKDQIRILASQAWGKSSILIYSFELESEGPTLVRARSCVSHDVDQLDSWSIAGRYAFQSSREYCGLAIDISSGKLIDNLDAGIDVLSFEVVNQPPSPF